MGMANIVYYVITPKSELLARIQSARSLDTALRDDLARRRLWEGYEIQQPGWDPNTFANKAKSAFLCVIKRKYHNTAGWRELFSSESALCFDNWWEIEPLYIEGSVLTVENEENERF